MVTRKGKKWYIVKCVNGKQKWIATGKESREEAEMLERSLSILKDGDRDRFVKIATAIYGDSKGLDRMELSSLMGEYPSIAKSLGVRISKESMRKRKNHLGRLAVWAEQHAKSIRFADEVTIAVAWRFIDSLDSASVNTQRKIAGELSSIWEALQKRDYVSTNPWKTAKPQKDASVQKHGRAFTMDEVRRLLESSPHDWIRHTIVIGLYTGLRLGDIFALKWENIDFDNAIIKRLKPSKTARHDIEVTIPLHEALKAYLTHFRAPRGTIVQATCRADQFGEYFFTKMLEKAEIEQASETKLSFHCLRHTFATLLAKSGATEQERMRLGGWTNASTAQIYNHDMTNEKKIIDSLPSL